MKTNLLLNKKVFVAFVFLSVLLALFVFYSFATASESIFDHRNFPNIRTWAVIYGLPSTSNPANYQAAMDFIKNHFDVIQGPSISTKQYIGQTKLLAYSLFSYVYLWEPWSYYDPFKVWADGNVSSADDYESMFTHLKSDSLRTQNTNLGTNMRFFRGWVFNGTSYQKNGDFYNKEPSNIQILTDTSSYLYLGFPEGRFKEINFALSTAGRGLNLSFEYWNGSSWQSLTVNDGTNDLTQSGKVEFFPPVDWKETKINSELWASYYIRIKTSTVTQAPTASTILGEDICPEIGGKTLVRGWDPANDKDGDGFVDDTEFVNLANSNSTARLKYQARNIRSGDAVSWSTNPGSQTFKNFFLHLMKETLNSDYDGVFYDEGFSSIYNFSGENILEYQNDIEYQQDVVDLVSLVRSDNPGAVFSINTCQSQGSWVEDYGKATGSILAEFWIQPEQYDWLKRQADVIKNRSKNTNVSTIFLSTPNVNSKTEGSLDRERMWDLAANYIMQYDFPYAPTFFDIRPYGYGLGWNSTTQTSNNWFKAEEYDVGTPIGDYYEFATGPDPSTSGSTLIQFHILARDYSNALILVRPDSSWCTGSPNYPACGTNNSASAVTENLNGTYYPLRVDGTLGDPVTKITLKNSEAAILIKNPKANCSLNSDCSAFNGDCSTAVCTDGKCVVSYRPSSYACRSASGECDATEYCTGSSVDCPTDSYKTAGTKCSAGVCSTIGSCIGCLSDSDCVSGFSCLDKTCVNKLFVAYYPFEGDAINAKGNGYNGTATGVSFDSGKCDKAAGFNGSNYINVGNLNTNVYTVLFWAYFPTEINSSSPKTTLIQYGPNTGSDLGQYIVGTGSITNYIDGETLTVLGGSVGRTAIKDIISPGWHHLAFRWNFQSLKYDIFLDGVKKNAYTSTNGWVFNSPAMFFNNLLIGADSSKQYQGFTGKIDELKIWNYDLSDNGIAQEYSSCFNSSSPVSYTITATAGSNGAITPSGASSVDSSSSKSFTITPNSGYYIADVLVDGSSIGVVTSYTFSNVASNHTISVSFVTISTPICSSFTYSAWSVCQSNSTQSRATASSSPAGCTGGTPILSQSCTYDNPSPDDVVVPETPALNPQSEEPLYLELNGSLYYGKISPEVSTLQKMLSKDKTIFPEQKVSGIFGKITEAAVQRFQCKYLALCSGSYNTNGYGTVGPRTITKINEIYGSFSAAPQNADTPQMSQSGREALIGQLRAQIAELLRQIILLLQEQIRNQ